MRSIIRILLASAALGALSPFAGAALAWGDEPSRSSLAYLWFFTWPSAIENALFHDGSSEYAVMALVYAVQYAAVLLVLDAVATIGARLRHKGRQAHPRARVSSGPG
jgi:hypothetical protein